MAPIPQNVLLSVTELSDLKTISSLVCAHKHFHGIIRQYETSIVKAKLRHYEQLTSQPPLPPVRKGQEADDGRVIEKGGMWPEDHLRHPLVAPAGSVLKSATVDRGFLPPYSFSVIQELDSREARHEALFAPGTPLHSAVVHSGLFDGRSTTKEEAAVLIARLRRACRLADRLSDCAAGVMVGNDFRGSGSTIKDPMGPEEQRYQGQNGVSGTPPPAPLTCRPDQHNTTLNTPNPTTAPDPHRHRLAHRSTSRAIRHAQLTFIQSLPLADLAFLALLTSLAGLAYCTLGLHQRPRHSHSDEDLYRDHLPPDPQVDPGSILERVTAFQETVLREGAAVALWGTFAGLGGQSSPADDGEQAAELGDSDACSTTPVMAEIRAVGAFVDRKVEDVLLELRCWEMGGGRPSKQSGGWGGDGEDGLEEGGKEGEEGEGEGEEEEEGMLPGLQMTIWGAIRRRTGWAGVSVAEKVDAWVKEAVAGSIGV